MKVLAKAGISACLALLTACGSAPPREEGPPDWVSGAAAGYPAGSYLLGRGAAADLNDAMDRARADLAQGLEVEIRMESSDVQTFALESDVSRREQTDERMKLEVTRRIASRTDQIIRGVQIAETWRDATAATNHALAVLPRASAMLALRADIDTLDRATMVEIERARAAADPLAAIAAADRAVQHQVERAAVQQMLQVVDPSGHGIPSRWSVAQLRADRQGLITRLRIRPHTAGDETQAVAVALGGALGEAGFTVVENGPADYTLAAVLALTDLGMRDGWYWVTGRLEVVLGDQAGQARGSHRWDIKASGQDARLAHQRALDEVETTLDHELLATVIAFSAKE